MREMTLLRRSPLIRHFLSFFPPPGFSSSSFLFARPPSLSLSLSGELKGRWSLRKTRGKPQGTKVQRREAWRGKEKEKKTREKERDIVFLFFFLLEEKASKRGLGRRKEEKEKTKVSLD